MVELVRPGDCQELLPPAGGNERDVEAEDEGERDESEKGIEISHNTLEKPGEKVPICSIIIIRVSPLLHRIHHLSVDCPENGVDDEEEKQLSAYQLVQRPLPLEEKPREASRCGRGHVPLIRDSHLCTLKIS